MPKWPLLLRTCRERKFYCCSFAAPVVDGKLILGLALFAGDFRPVCAETTVVEPGWLLNRLCSRCVVWSRVCHLHLQVQQLPSLSCCVRLSNHGRGKVLELREMVNVANLGL